MCNDKFVNVDDWVPTEEDNIIKKDGKLLNIPFSKIFGNPELQILDKFLISKESYVFELDNIAKYLNYFIKFYDKENELLTAYLRMRFILSTDRIDKLTIKAFNKIIRRMLLTKSIREKIHQMVEDNYHIDLSSKKSNTKYSESLEFTNEHAKIFHEITIAMKILIPVIFHYLNVHNIDKNKLHKLYLPLFDMFDKYHLYNKLTFIIANRIKTSSSKDRPIWNQREIMGVSADTKLVDILHGKLLRDTMFKIMFSGNIISYIYSIIDKQLNFFIREEYDKNRIEVNDDKDFIEGLSGIDKLEMNLSKMDETSILLSDVSIENMLFKLQIDSEVELPTEELKYYLKHTKIEKFTTEMAFYYFARHFKGYREMSCINEMNRIKLLVILKHRLIKEGYYYLPKILTGNVLGKLNTRTIRNCKFLNKMRESDSFNRITNEKYYALKELGKEELIINILSTLINTKFTIVDYDHPEQLGQIIDIEKEYDKDRLSDEFLRYVEAI